MVKIVLTQPFIHHYQGSVFELAEATSYAGWDEDERVRDRIHLHDKKVFDLPDDGRGHAAQLPVHMTKPCPQSFLDEIDIKSGPCRITFVSIGLENKDDPYYTYPTPEGKGKVLLKDNGPYNKNSIFIDLKKNEMPESAVIINAVSGVKTCVLMGTDSALDFSSFYPGFYQVNLIKENKMIHQFNMIKCFPVVVTFNDDEEGFFTTKTIW